MHIIFLGPILTVAISMPESLQLRFSLPCLAPLTASWSVYPQIS